MFNRFKKSEDFKSPVGGKVINIVDVPDPVFAEKMMGEGYAIIPNTGEILAPLSGNITFVTETNHAIGITTKNGFEVLIHIGIDSVLLNGKGFHSFVKVNDTVKQGDTLMKVDIEYLKANCKSEMVIVLFPANNNITLLKEGLIVDPLESNTITID